MKEEKKDFLDSLDLTDKEVEEFIPFILQDLWELGSMPKYIIDLVKENINENEVANIIDLGCGKGAVLIKLGKEFNFTAVGIDLVQEFIDAARFFANKEDVQDRINFKTGDINDYISTSKDNDIVIYGYDSSVLGDVYESLLQLKKCTRKGGWIIFEIAFTENLKERIEGLPTEKELLSHIDKSGLERISKVIWDVEEIKEVNNRNNKLIGQRINELIAKYPKKRNIFEKYLQNQFEECKLIEEDMICSTWLLRNSND